MGLGKELIGRGAEARIYLARAEVASESIEFINQKAVLKERSAKHYRIPEIDIQFRKSRTRREAKVLEKLEKLREAGIYAPKLNSMDDKKMMLSMEFIEGEKLRDVLEKLDCKGICERLGKKIAVMHSCGIIHSDLTTSNMILRKSDNKIYLIDFGLSFFSEKLEDKAVDLHLLRQALESKHYSIWEKCFEAVLQGYRNKTGTEQFLQVMKRLMVVENRGRYKHKTDYYTALYGKFCKIL